MGNWAPEPLGVATEAARSGPGSAEGGLVPMIYIQSHHGGLGSAAGQVREAGAAFRRFFFSRMCFSHSNAIGSFDI